jgi:parallel beta-helix repeat protein
MKLWFWLLVTLPLAAQTVTFNESSVVRSNPYKIGLNIGTVSFYGSGQVYKNLLAEANAGFEPLQTQQVWTQTVAGTANTFTVPDIYPTVAANRFAGATYTIVESATAAKGCAGTISSNTAGNYPNAVVYTLGTPCAAATSAGDTILVKLNELPTAEAAWEGSANGVWGSVTGTGKLTTDSTTPYDGAQSLVLDTSAGGTSQVSLFFDSETADRFVNLNGAYTLSLAAKLISGSGQSISVTLTRGSLSCTFNATPTSTWAVYSTTCTAAETASTPNSLAGVAITMNATGGKIEIDDVSLVKTSGADATNTTVFRDEVVNAIKAYCGGIAGQTCPIRDWVNQNGENLDNWIATSDLNAKQTVAGDGSATSSSPTPRLQEFLQLVHLVNGVPYLEVPVTFTTTDAANLIEFLESTNVSAGYGLKRANLGQTTPWIGPTGVFPEIYLSFCNECWNSSTAGQNMPYRSSASTYYYDYARRAGDIYKAMRADASFIPSATHLGFNMQLGVTYLLSTDIASMASNAGAPDYIEQAPYTQTTVSNYATDAALWGSAMEEPYGDAADPASSSGYYQGVAAIQAINSCGQSGTAACIATDYEQANSTVETCGVAGNPACGGTGNTALDQTHSDYINAGAGEGIIAPLQALLNEQLLNVGMQNYFALTEYNNNTLYSNTAKLWGVVVDMGGAGSVMNAAKFGGSYMPRPQMLGVMLANQAIIGSMYSCPISTNLTYNWAGDTVNGPTHALNNVPYLYAFCFKSGNTRSMVLINTDMTSAHNLTFAGTNPPTGTVSLGLYSPSSLDSLNEAATPSNTDTIAAAVSNSTSTLSSPALYSLPASSVSTLTWSVASAGPATYYVSNSGSDSNAGTSSTSPWQTVAKVNATTLNPGDTVLFQSGGLWREKLVAPSSGTSGKPISFGNYGSGAQPIITGGNLVSWTNVSGNIWSTPQTTNPLFPNFGGTPGIQETSQAALTAANEWYWNGSSTLYVYSATNPASIVEIPARAYAFDLAGNSYISVTGLEFRGAQTYGLQCQSSTASGCSYLTITNNKADLNYSNGITILTTASGDYSTNGTATGNTMTNNGSSGLKIGGYWNTWTISGNTATYNCLSPSSSPSFDNQFCGGIYVFSVSGTDGTGTTISSNQANYNGLTAQANSSVGNGIWADTVAGVTVSNNTAHDNESNGIYLEKTTNSVAYRNLGWNNSTLQYTGCLVVAAGQTHNSTNNLVYENTCSGGYSALQLNFEDTNGTMSGNVIQNNIFIGTGSSISLLASAQVNDGTHGSGNVFTHNAFGAPRSNQFYWNSNFYSTYASFEAAYGGSTYSLQVDPALVNVSSNNFNLTTSSPARSFGIIYSGYPNICGDTDLGALAYPEVCPNAPTAGEGQSVTVAASYPASFSLSGSGACTGCGVAGARSVTYTAPATVTPQHVMLGCPVMPNDTVFNTRIDSLPLDSRSSTWASNSSQVGFQFQPSWGISYADSSTPTRVLKSYYGNFVNVFPWPTGGDMKREGGNYIGGTGFASPDHHVMTVRRTDCTFFDAYGDKLNNVTVTCQDGVTQGCNLSSAITYPWSNYQVQAAGGTDAAGLPLAPLVMHLSEIKAGAINHALRFTTALGYIQGSGNLGTPYLWPAALSNGCPTSTCPNVPIIGARARLKASFNISTFSATAQIILTAMQRYGIILADIGTSNAITTATDVTADTTATSALNEIQGAAIGMSNFEFVDESSLEVNANSYQVCPLNQTCAGAANTYEAPVNSAVISAAPTSGSAITVPVALQGVSIGCKVGPDVLVMAGTYSWTISTWVNGSSNQNVTWSLVSGVGTITTAGVYTPPSNTAGGTAAVLKGVAAADSTATITLYVTIIPPGTIRLDTGATANTTDGSGNTWLGGLQPEGWAVQYNDNYPGWTTTSPLRIQYQTGVYTYSNDITYYGIILPNGNYDVSYLLGLNNQCGTTPCGSYPKTGSSSIYSYSPVHLESQGEIGAFAYDWLLPIGYVSAAPSPIVAVPAKVTNNVLYASIRGVANDVAPFNAPGTNLTKTTVLQGLTISSDTSSPHWTVSTQQQSTIASGQTLNPFLVIDWFTGVNDPTWSVVGPPGISINSSSGVLTAASGTYLAGQPVTVTASDGTYSAKATIYTAGAKYAINPLPIPNHYYFKRAIVINHAQVNSADQANFPVEISITDPTLATVANGGHVQNANGYDMILTSDAAGHTLLNWDVEKYDPVAGAWVVHVKIPTLSHTADTTIYAFYGNPVIIAPQFVAKNTWDANYKGVYHFAGPTLSVADSTANANNGTNAGFVYSATGQIGGAALTTNGSVTLPAAVLDSPAGTIDMWIDTINKPENTTENWALVNQDWATPGTNYFQLGWSTTDNAMDIGWKSSGTDYHFSLPAGQIPISENTWYHLAYAWDSSVPVQNVYLNGALVFTTANPFTTYSITSPAALSYPPNPSYYGFDGLMDEVRFSSILRTASWIATQYANQSSPGTFAKVGSEQSN